MIRVGSLFSGIGGLDVGVEAALGGHTIMQVEQNPFAQKVLRRHWPHAELVTDVRDVRRLQADVCVGGFPCQGFSQAGKRGGFCDSRSALWTEMLRIVGENMPAGVVVENVVEMLRVGAAATVAHDLRQLGYSVDEPQVVSAESVGAPQRRLRVFIVAVLPQHRWNRILPYTHSVPPKWLVRPDWPAPRGQKQRPNEPPRTLPKATRYPGTFKRERLHALGNAVVPEVAYRVGLRLVDRLKGASPFTATGVVPSSSRKDLWPTPVTTDAKGARRNTARGEHWASNEGVTLTDAVWLEGRSGLSTDDGRPLNPDWVETLMGFPPGWTMP